MVPFGAVLQCSFAMQFCIAELQYSFSKQKNWSIFGPHFKPLKCFLDSLNCYEFKMGLQILFLKLSAFRESVEEGTSGVSTQKMGTRCQVYQEWDLVSQK